MITKMLLPALLICQTASASAQLSSSTFGGIPIWADSALRAAGLNQRFMLTSTLNPIYGFGDFDRDGLVDVAVEVKDAAGLRCGIAITHRIDRSVHIVGAGEPVGNGANEVECGRWSVATPQLHRHTGLGPDLLYISDSRAHNGWLAWNGRSYVWVAAD